MAEQFKVEGFEELFKQMDELAEEIGILSGHSIKNPGNDGLIGESIDTIITEIF